MSDDQKQDKRIRPEQAEQRGLLSDLAQSAVSGGAGGLTAWGAGKLTGGKKPPPPPPPAEE